MKTSISRIAFLLITVIALGSCNDNKKMSEEKVAAPESHRVMVENTDEVVKMMLERFEDVVDLSDEQKAKLTEIINAQDPQVLNTDADARKAMRQKMVSEVFTPEQQQKWREFIKNKKNEGSH